MVKSWLQGPDVSAVWRLMLGGATVLMASIGWVASSDLVGLWVVMGLAGILGLWEGWRRHHKARWLWFGVVSGCLLGMVGGIALTAEQQGRQGASLIEDVYRFEQPILYALDKGDCERALMLLSDDRLWESSRSGIGLVVRGEVWGQTRDSGCIDEERLAQERARLRALIPKASWMGLGLSTEQVQARFEALK